MQFFKLLQKKEFPSIYQRCDKKKTVQNIDQDVVVRFASFRSVVRRGIGRILTFSDARGRFCFGTYISIWQQKSLATSSNKLGRFVKRNKTHVKIEWITSSFVNKAREVKENLKEFNNFLLSKRNLNCNCILLTFYYNRFDLFNRLVSYKVLLIASICICDIFALLKLISIIQLNYQKFNFYLPNLPNSYLLSLSLISSLVSRKSEVGALVFVRTYLLSTCIYLFQHQTSMGDLLFALESELEVKWKKSLDCNVMVKAARRNAIDEQSRRQRQRQRCKQRHNPAMNDMKKMRNKRQLKGELRRRFLKYMG
jgi:hypothetical protein